MTNWSAGSHWLPMNVNGKTTLTEKATIAILGAGVLLAGAVWHYGPAMRNWSAAGDECLKFATENDVTIAFDADPKAKPIVYSQWLKGRHVVVEMGQKVKGKNAYGTRLCVVGNDGIEIPGGFEQSEWR